MAFASGILVAMMIFFNGSLAEQAGLYYSTFVFHFIGLLFVWTIRIGGKSKSFRLREIPLAFFLPGGLSVVSVLLNSVCMLQLGVTLTIGISMLGQLIVSNVIDHFGLMGMPVIRFRKEKLIGMGMVFAGIGVMIFL